MNTKIVKWLIVLVVIIGVAATFFTSYNGFVSKEEEVNKSWAQVENQLQRRADLIPNLVETVKGYASQEKEIYTDIADARAKLAGSESPEEQAKANDQLSSALNRLLVVVENYPELKSNENFQQLMDELSGTENRLSVARKDYNDIVSSFNTQVKRFPGMIVARMAGFDEKEYFKASEGAQEPVKVDFGTQK
ncbi:MULTISPECIES: LemA family protein [Bacillus]|uniref:LemA family protein n=1 Tax=Bacillus TaxID=1386 RepID=UPI000318470D|nr:MULTISPECIES: LemA family protein [Bacillus]